MFQGFRRTEIDDYNEEYYRKWMHEIPPLRHFKRSVVLDLHHNILPLTVETTPDIKYLHQDAITLNCGLKVLSNVDMFLHCAVHLFHEGEFEKGLRDLIDLDYLFRYFIDEDENFETKLINRAIQLGLSYNLFLATYFCKLILKTELSPHYITQIRKHSPNKYKLILLRYLFKQVLIPHHSTCKTWHFRLACNFLYIRGHLVRMPLRLLIPHLFKKSLMAIKESIKKEKPDALLP